MAREAQMEGRPSKTARPGPAGPTTRPAADSYVLNVLRSCAAVTAAHLILGLALARALRGRHFKGWPLYTYWHSMVQTGLIFPAFIALFASRVRRPAEWLRGADEMTSDELGAEQWVQTTNIGFQVAITILNLKKVLATPALLLHHLITILGCFSLLHRRHCSGYGAAFTTVTEFGSTFHNIMSLHGHDAARYLRVFTDLLTRGGGLCLIARELPISRRRGLPLHLQVWSCVGGLAWFGINAQWTLQVLRGLVRKWK